MKKNHNNMNGSKVSIVVPVYNVEKYLDMCVDSLVNQTYGNLEIILVDDGSTDTSPQMCDKWAENDSRVKVLHKQNEGAGIARSMGMKIAQGEYILFVDSDDYLDISTIEKCIDNAQKKNADIVVFGRKNVRDTKIDEIFLYNEKKDYIGEKEIVEFLSGLFNYKIGIGISVWGKLFKLDIIKKNGIDFVSERKFLSEDALFILSIFSYVKRLSVLPENLYYYCYNPVSLSRKYSSDYQDKTDAFLCKGKELCQVYKYPIDVYYSVCARYHMYTIAGLKSIVALEIRQKEKYKIFSKVIKNRLLHKTLMKEILKKESKKSRLFWLLVKFRLYILCYFLLVCKVR